MTDTLRSFCTWVVSLVERGLILTIIPATSMIFSRTKCWQNLTARWSYWREAGSHSASMKSRFVPAEIFSAAQGKIQIQKERSVLSWTYPVFFCFVIVAVFFFLLHLCFYCCPVTVGGVCEKAVPQGHSQQPSLDAQLLSQPAVWTSGTSQGHQRTAVPGGPQWQHEWHQDPERKGGIQDGGERKQIQYQENFSIPHHIVLNPNFLFL